MTVNFRGWNQISLLHFPEVEEMTLTKRIINVIKEILAVFFRPRFDKSELNARFSILENAFLHRGFGRTVEFALKRCGPNKELKELERFQKVLGYDLEALKKTPTTRRAWYQLYEASEVYKMIQGVDAPESSKLAAFLTKHRDFFEHAEKCVKELHATASRTLTARSIAVFNEEKYVEAKPEAKILNYSYPLERWLRGNYLHALVAHFKDSEECVQQSHVDQMGYESKSMRFTYLIASDWFTIDCGKLVDTGTPDIANLNQELEREFDQLHKMEMTKIKLSRWKQRTALVGSKKCSQPFNPEEIDLSCSQTMTCSTFVAKMMVKAVDNLNKRLGVQLRSPIDKMTNLEKVLPFDLAEEILPKISKGPVSLLAPEYALEPYSDISADVR